MTPPFGAPGLGGRDRAGLVSRLSSFGKNCRHPQYRRAAVETEARYIFEPAAERSSFVK